MKRLAVIVLLFAAPAFAADTPEPPKATAAPKVSVPKTKAVNVGERFSIAPVITDGGAPKWELPDRGGLKEDRTFLDLIPDEMAAKLKGRVFYSDAPGVYRIFVYCGGDNRTASDIAVCTVTVGDAPPPVPPNPPGPTPPGPTPPGPTPGPVANLRVLITYNAADVTKLPAAQQSVLYSKAVRDALDAATAIGPNGRTHQWRLWDKAIDASDEGPGWADLMKRPQPNAVNVIFAGDAGVAFEGPLPATVPDMLALIQKYAPKSLRKAG